MKVLCMGSLNLDHTYRVARFAQPGETTSVRSYSTNPGGKGLNQAIALARAGAAVWMGGCVGPDGAALRKQLRADGVDCTFLRQVPEATGHAIIQVDDSGENCILVCRGANHCLTEEQIAGTFSQFSRGDVLLLQNEVNLLPSLLRTGKERGMEIFLNPSPVDDALQSAPLEKADWLILNEVELEALSGTNDPETGLREMAYRYPQIQFVLTLGRAGAVYRFGAQQYRQAAFPVETVDTTAAGDTFTGYFIETYLRTRDPQKSLTRAALAASMAVTRPGAAVSIPDAKEVQKHCRDIHKEGEV